MAPIHYSDERASDWMARLFFTGGIMPSQDLPLRYDDHLQVVDQWRVGGLHYSLTLEAWLAEMDRNQDRLLPVFAQTFGTDSERWFARWRMFFMACSELFRYRGGDEWFVAHTLMRPRDAAAGNECDANRWFSCYWRFRSQVLPERGRRKP